MESLNLELIMPYSAITIRWNGLLYLDVKLFLASVDEENCWM